MATAIDASCSLLDGKPASGQCEDECHSDDETDSESEADIDVGSMDVAGPEFAQTTTKSGNGIPHACWSLSSCPNLTFASEEAALQ